MLTRSDSQIDFNWGWGSPDYRVAGDHFSARWTGSVRFDSSRTYTFSARSDDGVRVWVDDALVIDGWYDHAPLTFSGNRWLGAGDHYIRVEYYERAGTAEIDFWWDGGAPPPPPPPTGAEIVVDEQSPGFVWGGSLHGRYNAWLGYGMLFYGRQDDDVRFMDTVTRVADYILDHQVITPTDPRYGLFTGGAGGYLGGVFTDTIVNWVATEHNIDAYFFMRDLGQMMDESRYVDAAGLLRDSMPRLWDETKGRLNQGMDVTGTLNANDALDAASWGAMYWTAVGDLEKAKRSLEYADHAYSNTVMISPTLSIWGYNPYSGTAEGFDWSTVDVVWSEGSLGVAMADLKLGHALLDRGDSAGGDYIEQAEDILVEMVKLQAVYTDTYGGLLYAVSSGGVITDFPAAPSAAGTTWLLMVQQAMEDKDMRDAFWGPDSGLINRVTITGPRTVWVDTPHTFTAVVNSITATLPITYVWHATGQDGSTTHTSGLSHAISFGWTTPGAQEITITATNARDRAMDTHAITVCPCNIYLPIVLRNRTP